MVASTVVVLARQAEWYCGLWHCVLRTGVGEACAGACVCGEERLVPSTINARELRFTGVGVEDGVQRLWKSYYYSTSSSST